MIGAEEAGGFYGVMMPERRIHASPLCPTLSPLKARRGELNRYPSQVEAMIGGHVSRCEVCFNMYRFTLRVGGKLTEALLYLHEIQILKVMVDIRRGDPNRPVKLSHIAARVGITITKTHESLKRLNSLGMVSGARLPSGAFSSKGRWLQGRKKLYPLALAVVAAYEVGAFLAPPEPLNNIPVGTDKLHNRLF